AWRASVARPSSAVEREQRKRREPVRTDERVAREAFPTGSEMSCRGRLRDCDARIAGWQRGRDTAKAPRARQVEAVEMNELRVGAVVDVDRCEQLARLPVDELRQERRQPF